MTKAEAYLQLVHNIARGVNLRSSTDVKMDPSCIDFYLVDKKESISVWEDVRALVNKQYKVETDKTAQRMMDVILNRLAWLKGTWKSPFSIKEKAKYIRNFENYDKFFNEETITKALENVNIKDFIKIQECYGYQEEYANKKGYIEVGPCYREKTINTRGRREVIKEHGTKFYMPDDYQVKEKEFLKDCMDLEFPYIQNYEIQSYKLEKPFEFYVKVEKQGSLYIPFECLKTKTIEPAVKRMNEYFNWYYGKKPEELQRQLGLMESNVFKRLKKDIERG